MTSRLQDPITREIVEAAIWIGDDRDAPARRGWPLAGNATFIFDIARAA